MILPFVREFFADVEKLPAFARAVAQVRRLNGASQGRDGVQERGSAGGIRVSGLTPTGKALFYPTLRHAVSRPVIVVVSDNRAIDDLLPVVRSFSELTGSLHPDAVVALPAYDVLPF